MTDWYERLRCYFALRGAVVAVGLAFWSVVLAARWLGRRRRRRYHGWY